MRFDIELSDRAVDLVDEGFDVAVRIGPIGSQNLVGRKVGETRLVCCAAPSYLAQHGEPATPEDLAGHACLTYEYSSLGNVWPFRDRAGSERNVRVVGPVHANNGRFLEALAVEGVGIVYEPDFIVGPDVQRGKAHDDPARVRSAASVDLRHVSQPAPFVRQGSRVHRFPGGAVRGCRLEALAACEAVARQERMTRPAAQNLRRHVGPPPRQ